MSDVTISFMEMAERAFKERDALRATIDRITAERDALAKQLEYAYRCIEFGFVYGKFDFSVLRTNASIYLAKQEEATSALSDAESKGGT